MLLHGLIHFPHYNRPHISTSSKLQENEAIYYECIPSIPLSLLTNIFQIYTEILKIYDYILVA